MGLCVISILIFPAEKAGQALYFLARNNKTQMIKNK